MPQDVSCRAFPSTPFGGGSSGEVAVGTDVGVVGAATKSTPAAAVEAASMAEGGGADERSKP